jgi:hypothetical protein
MTTQDIRWQGNDPDDPDDSHPQMALIGHHTQIKMKYLTHTHPLEQRIGIDTDIDPIVVIRLNPITTDVTMGGMPMMVVIIAPPTCPAH